MSKTKGTIKKSQSPETSILSPEQLDEVRVLHEQLGGIVSETDAYFTVVRPDGKQEFYAAKPDALVGAAKTGGRVIARPTRSALRLVAAAAGATAIPTDTRVEVHQGGVTHINNPYMSLVLFHRPDGEVTVIATTVLKIGDRETPGVGAASTDEHASEQSADRRASRSFGARLGNAVMVAATRASNRATSDGTGLVTLGSVAVQREEPPQTQIIRKARELGLPLQKIPQIIGKRIDQVSPEELPAALEALEDAVSNESGGEPT